jgi:hypothetical protein
MWCVLGALCIISYLFLTTGFQMYFIFNFYNQRKEQGKETLIQGHTPK